MPLAVICGYPCSGKTTLSSKLSELLSEPPFECTVAVLRDSDYGYVPSVTPYSDKEEKIVRASITAAVERRLKRNELIIVDASHEIKGWRYQLYCMARAIPTPQVIVYCATSAELCKKWNSLRNGETKYPDDILQQLIARFEFPDPHVRWDSPLFTIGPDDLIPVKEVYKALYASRAPNPHLATQSKPICEVETQTLLENITSSVLTHIQQMQYSGANKIQLPSWPKSLTFSKNLSVAEGQRLKRQFINLNKLKPLSSESQILNAFIEYLDAVLKR